MWLDSDLFSKEASFCMESFGNEERPEKRHHLQSAVENRLDFLSTLSVLEKIQNLLSCVVKGHQQMPPHCKFQSQSIKVFFCVLGDNDNFLKLLPEVLMKQFLCAPASAAVRRGACSAAAGRTMGGHNALCYLGHVRDLWEKSDAPAFPQREGGPWFCLILRFASKWAADFFFFFFNENV